MLAGAPWALRNAAAEGMASPGSYTFDDPVVVAVDAVPAGVLGGGVDGGAAPGVPGQAADAELHRPGRPGGVLTGMHPGCIRAALTGFGLADAGQDGPGDAVPGSGFLVVGEVGGGDSGCRGAGGRLGPAGRGGLAEYPGTSGEERHSEQHQRRSDGGRDLDAAGVRVRAHLGRLPRCAGGGWMRAGTARQERWRGDGGMPGQAGARRALSPACSPAAVAGGGAGVVPPAWASASRGPGCPAGSQISPAGPPPLAAASGVVVATGTPGIPPAARAPGPPRPGVLPRSARRAASRRAVGSQNRTGVVMPVRAARLA